MAVEVLHVQVSVSARAPHHGHCEARFPVSEVLIDVEIDLYLSRHTPVSSAAAQLSEKPIVTKIGRKFCIQFL
jgi:hypothetical protein